MNIYKALDNRICDVSINGSNIIYSDYYDDSKKASINFFNIIGSYNFHIRIYGISHNKYANLIIYGDYEN